MQRLALICALFALVAGAALADPRVEERPTAPLPTTEQLTARGAEIIAAGDAQGIFVQEPSTRAILLRHPPSGLACHFLYRSNSSVRVFEEGAHIRRGDDVDCTEGTPHGSYTISATRLPPIALDEQLARTVGIALEPYTEVHELDVDALPTSPTIASTPLPTSRSAAFIVQVGDRERFYRVSVYSTNGWDYNMVFVAPTERGNVLADALWRTLLLDLDSHKHLSPASD